jgi:hypothetical protein
MRGSDDDGADDLTSGADYKVGYRRPPLHSRFQPGVSGNPSGRPKGTPNLKTIFEQILKEQISLREGSVTKKITKAEAVVRSLVISAMKGDSRSQQNLFRLAEQIGQFVEPPVPLQRIERVIVDPRDMRRDLVAIGADEP